jgi:hypothetical protein
MQYSVLDFLVVMIQLLVKLMGYRPKHVALSNKR